MLVLKRVLLLCLAVISLATQTGCATWFAPINKDDSIKIAYICKDLDNKWFVEVSKGLGKKCMELGMEYKAFDADFDDAACLEALDEAIKWGTDALAICTTNQELGAQISRSCKNASIPILTIDDTMVNDEGKLLPHLGMPSYEIGVLGGTALGRMALERGLFEEKIVVRVLQINVPTLSVIGERLNGYNDALMMATPLTKDDITVVDSASGMYNENLIALDQADLHYDSNTRWLVTGVNDDSALACIHALTDKGYSKEDILACGLGGYSIDEFKAGNRNYITIVTQPHLEGEKAAEMLYNYLKNGEELSDMTIVGGKVATIDNYMMLISDENE